ncbi:hypothetical protein, partial [Xanthomonas oryzae]|uniref:hypothetical protein n=1 Tax=Xanthomonas oryzae TaxID=347 RepID=UPI000965D634
PFLISPATIFNTGTSVFQSMFAHIAVRSSFVRTKVSASSSIAIAVLISPDLQLQHLRAYR